MKTQGARIAIIGTGLVGRGWALSFARAGHDVVLWDREPAAPALARDYIADVLPDLAHHDLLSGQDLATILARISIEADLSDALKGVDYVQENTPDDLAIKRATFELLDPLAPRNVILASSTSGICSSLFTEGLLGRERCLVVHPINPPYLIPAVEIVPAPWTSEETIARTRSILLAAGHAPVVMKRELEGFLVNRIQAALLDAAFGLVADGYATAEDVDVCIREGLALRWSFMGPFETIDLNAPQGVRDYVSRYHPMYSRILSETQSRVPWDGPVLETVERDRRAVLPQEQLPARQVWRDRRLMALASHKRKAAQDFGI